MKKNPTAIPHLGKSCRARCSVYNGTPWTRPITCTNFHSDFSLRGGDQGQVPRLPLRVSITWLADFPTDSGRRDPTPGRRARAATLGAGAAAGPRGTWRGAYSKARSTATARVRGVRCWGAGGRGGQRPSRLCRFHRESRYAPGDPSFTTEGGNASFFRGCRGIGSALTRPRDAGG